jgi:hypothetical protein
MNYGKSNPYLRPGIVQAMPRKEPVCDPAVAELNRMYALVDPRKEGS